MKIDIGQKLFIIWVLFPVFVFGADISSQKVIHNVEEKLISAKTAKVKFEEIYIWKLTGEKQSLKGELFLKGKDQFRITTEDQIIVSDGKILWTYSKPSNRVLIDKLSNSKDTLLPSQILFQYTRDYTARMGGEEKISGKPCYLLIFETATGDVFIPRVKVWVDKKEWVPRKVEQTDLNENRTIYLLSEIEIGISLNKDMFKFVVPKGAEVIDLR
ncbi:MAG: hypothetical protein DRP89_05625 [Candidatus Neomarinimicrobiota bacterium]|nr:MAG: hypothetical protein DRP89_05625 [Candidatus Neomarinimicrobiota bacterium]